MPRIPSANVADFERRSLPGTDPGYLHPADSRKGVIPLAFQVTSPFDDRTLLLPHALVMHVNPNSFDETFTKKGEVIQTLGGFVEQLWGDELSEISCEASTGGFINLYTGLSSVMRRETIAWDRFQDLQDLYHNNGSVYDPFGNIVLQGKIMLLYDRGTYLGTFRSFSYEETDTSPFSFTLSFSFKVEKVIYKIPTRTQAVGKALAATQVNVGPSQPPVTVDARIQQINADLKADAQRRQDEQDTIATVTITDSAQRAKAAQEALVPITITNGTRPEGSLAPAKAGQVADPSASIFDQSSVPLWRRIRGVK